MWTALLRTWDIHTEDNSIIRESLFHLNCLMFVLDKLEVNCVVLRNTKEDV